MSDETRPDKQNRNAPIEDQRGIFSKFLSEIEDDDRKETFLKSLDEEEKISFVTSMEEFRQIFGRDPEHAFPKEKSEFERDVSFSEVKEDRIRERFDEVMEMFPQNQSIDGLKNKSKHNDKDPSGSMFRSTDDLRKASTPDIQINIHMGSSHG